MAAAFNVATVILYDSLEMPAQKRAMVADVLWSKEAVSRP